MPKGGREESTSKCQMSPQQQKPPSEKRGSRRKQGAGWITSVIVVLVKACPALLLGSVVLELIASHVGNITLVITVAGPLLLGVVIAVSEDLFKPSEDDEKPEEDDGLFDRMAMGVRNIWYRIWTNTKLTLLFAGIAYLLGCTALATNHTGGRVLSAAKNTFDRLITYEETAADAGDTLHTSPNLSSIMEESDPEVSKVQSSYVVPSQYVQLLEPDRILALSDAEREELYYFTGEYAVDKEGSEEAVYSEVSTRIAALVRQEREDEFNQTEENDKNRALAKKASDDEGEMETSEDLDEVIQNRKDVYEKVPGAEIAKLIAENYNGYSLAYYSIGGSKKTMEYYWNESLIWYHECLTFQDSLGDISGVLNRIGMRYHDLAMIQKSGSDEQIRATMLSKAYNALAEYYEAAG